MSLTVSWGNQFFKAVQNARASEMLELMDQGANTEFADYVRHECILHECAQSRCCLVPNSFTVLLSTSSVLCLVPTIILRMFLLCRGGSASATQKQNGDTALIWTATNGEAEHVRLLLDAGAEKDAKNKVRDLKQNDHDCVFWMCASCT
jgi:hypothetical protein